MLRRWLAFSSLLCLALSLSASQPLSKDEALEQIQPLVTELVALRSVNALNLSSEQAQKLLALARRVQEIWSEYRERKRQVLQEQVEAFTAFRTEDLLNVGFNPETERQTAIANERGKNLDKWLANSIAPFAEEAARILNEEQRAIAEQMHSANIVTAIKVRLAFVTKQPNQPLDPVAQIRRELAEIQRAEYGEITPIGRFLLNPALVSVLEQKLGLQPSPIQPLVDRRFIELERTVRVLRTEINILNLINGLHLTSEQLTKLQELAHELGEVLSENSPTIDPFAFNELVRNLQRMRQILLSGQEVPRPILLRAGQLARQAGILPQPNPKASKLREIASKVLLILTDEQKQVLADYKPCLIPPKNLKDPVRVGQAPNTTGFIKALERLKRIPPAIYARRKAQIVEEIAKQIEAKGGTYPAGEREEFVRKLTELVDRVRSMSDTDFAMQAESLAEEFRKLYRKNLLEERLKELTSDQQIEILLGKVITNLLNPRLASILAERQLAQANLKPSKSEGLKSLPVYNTGGVCPKP